MSAELYVELNQKPEFILDLLEEIKKGREKASNYARRFYKYTNIGFLVGFILILFSIFFNPETSMFLLIGIAFLTFSFIGMLIIRSKVKVKVDEVYFPGAFKILHRLKDDSEKNVVGWLDLTNPIKKSNMYRSTFRKAYYRREWLNLNMALVDGSKLSLHLFSLYKVKKGYTYDKGNKAKVKIKIDREKYYLNVGKLGDFKNMVGYNHEAGIIESKFAFDPRNVNQILEILKLIYSCIERKEVNRG